MAKILIVEDDNKIARFVELELRHEGYETETATDGRTGLAKALEPQTDLVLLDIMLPELSGMEVCRRIRQESTVPVIMLTAKNTEYDRVVGLDEGADDFISKPFGMMELVARVRALLRRTRTEDRHREYRVGSLYVSPEKHIVRAGEQEVMLTHKEFELLCLLLENRGAVLTRDTLMDRIWGSGMGRENRTLDVHVRTLRAKLGEAGSCIETVRGVGYKIGGSV